MMSNFFEAEVFFAVCAAVGWSWWKDAPWIKLVNVIFFKGPHMFSEFGRVSVFYIYIYIYIEIGKKQGDYTFILTSLFRDYSLIKGFYLSVCTYIQTQHNQDFFICLHHNKESVKFSSHFYFLKSCQQLYTVIIYAKINQLESLFK